MYTPDASSPQPASPPPVLVGRGEGRTVAAGAGRVVRGGSAVRDGTGPGGFLLGAGLGTGSGLADGVGRGDGGRSCGTDCATGAVGRVEPTTKWIVRMTAVTLAAVQDSQMSR
ncbi:hypothetical protein ACIF8T_22330 [Streptomyces sp. NPDC085946]|uniref:hypothetical protein n=1 Tax=Streptomyces sp. NPDC085946 TaxID=3365744 RepID=UPI0037CECF2A